MALKDISSSHVYIFPLWNEFSLSKFIYCTFEYIPQFYERLRYGLLKYNINLTSKPPTKLKELIHSKIDPIPVYGKGEVFIIPFSTEHQKTLFYIVMTSRKIKERLKEHLSDTKFNKSSRALSRLHQKKILR